LHFEFLLGRVDTEPKDVRAPLYWKAIAIAAT